MTTPPLRLGALLMPSHPPERSVAEGQAWDLEEIERLDALGYSEAWIGEHFTAAWEPCPAPDLLISQALLRTKQIVLGPLGHLLRWREFLLPLYLELGLGSFLKRDPSMPDEP